MFQIGKYLHSPQHSTRATLYQDCLIRQYEEIFANATPNFGQIVKVTLINMHAYYKLFSQTDGSVHILVTKWVFS